MKKENKVALAIVLLAIFILPVVSAIPPEWDQEDLENRYDSLDFFSKLRKSGFLEKPFTAAGQERCSSQPYELEWVYAPSYESQYGSSVKYSGYSACKGERTLTSDLKDIYGNTLVNTKTGEKMGIKGKVYEDRCEEFTIKNGQYDKFLGGFESPRIVDVFQGIKAYECYVCWTLDYEKECPAGQKRCVTDSIYEVCEGGQWKRYNCASGTECGQGVCAKENVGAICGDGVCAPGEKGICYDCQEGNTGYCGDGECSSQEKAGQTCARDCGAGQGSDEAGNCISKIRTTISPTPKATKSGAETPIIVNVENTGDTACTFNVETAIYIDDFVRGSGLMTILQELRSCGGVLWEESFVDAKEIRLGANAAEHITFTPNAPTGTSLFGANAGEWALKRNWNEYGAEYTVISGVYEKCGGGYSYWDARGITISESGDITEKCGNGVIDDKEDCNNCPSDAGCAWNEECKGGLHPATLFGGWIGSLFAISEGGIVKYECKAINIGDIVWDNLFLIIIIIVILLVLNKVGLFRRIKKK